MLFRVFTLTGLKVKLSIQMILPVSVFENEVF